MDEEVHIGKLIYQKLKEEGRAASWLAGKMHCDRSVVYRIFQKSTIDISLLLHICMILDFDFFACYSLFFDTQKNKKKKCGYICNNL
jgi:hypothetical protein